MKIKRVLKWSASVIFLGLVVWFFIAYWTSSNDCARYVTDPTNPMKAIVSCEYGMANLQLRDIEKPASADNEVLVRVRAASVNPADAHLIRGAWPMRPMTGMRKPKNTRFGTDFAGVVEAIGKNVTNFKPGEEVFGAKNGDSLTFGSGITLDSIHVGAGVTDDQQAAHEIDLEGGGEVQIVLDLNMGDEVATVWTCDYSYDYIKINAEYHT